MTTAAANQATLANWMRVQINVRNGKDASAAARAAARLTTWHTIHPAYASDELHVYAVDFIPEGWAYVDPEKSRLAMARDSYFTLAHDAEYLKATIASMLAGGAPGLRRVPLSPGMAQAREHQESAPDRLEKLDEEYRALMSRLRAAADGADSRALGEGLAQVKALKERHANLVDELERLQGYDDTVRAMVRRLA